MATALVRCCCASVPPLQAREHSEAGGQGEYTFRVDKQYVQDRLQELVKKQDLTQYIL